MACFFAPAVEIRDYEPMLIAQVTTVGERNDAIRQGFSILFGSIFGKNDTSIARH
jgi:hypothetical protein